MSVKQCLVFDYFLIEFECYQNKKYERIDPLSNKIGNFITSLKTPTQVKVNRIELRNEF